jgi:hypothetical protein
MERKTQLHTLAASLAVAFVFTSAAFANEQNITTTPTMGSAFATLPQEQGRYQTLDGIPAEALSHKEMAEVEGKVALLLPAVQAAREPTRSWVIPILPYLE